MGHDKGGCKLWMQTYASQLGITKTKTYLKYFKILILILTWILNRNGQHYDWVCLFWVAIIHFTPTTSSTSKKCLEFASLLFLWSPLMERSFQRWNITQEFFVCRLISLNWSAFLVDVHQLKRKKKKKKHLHMFKSVTSRGPIWQCCGSRVTSSFKIGYISLHF